MPVPRSTLMLAVTEILSGKKMFNRGNLNNKNINGDSRECGLKKLFILQQESFLMLIFYIK